MVICLIIQYMSTKVGIHYLFLFVYKMSTMLKLKNYQIKMREEILHNFL